MMSWGVTLREYDLSVILHELSEVVGDEDDEGDRLKEGRGRDKLKDVRVAHVEGDGEFRKAAGFEDLKEVMESCYRALAILLWAGARRHTGGDRGEVDGGTTSEKEST